MDLVWTVLPVFLLCAEAQNLTVVKAELGQNATLNCSVNIMSIHWYVEIRSQVRGLIAETFTPDPNDTLYHIYTTLKTKYIAMGNKMVITNITSEDHRFYFCATKKKNNVIFRETFHFVSDGAAVKDDCGSEKQQCSCSMWWNELVVYSSFILNLLLFLVLTGVVFTSVCLKKKTCNYQVTDSPRSTNQSAETLETPQYEEIQLRAPPPAASSECIYYKAQLPQSTLPQY
ncbi:uncharacterized protein LOC126402894 isoform X1 [Epinephelus moara]|uniref:uncharacterized protein LOC126402894 isoform X1 n=1 Tax=Epinephelus moara TaxID=300413 RepID=UPI00214F28A3|nr:uncharacterized protein LOC126402894 isoform X1 [Epinephelus moara]